MYTLKYCNTIKGPNIICINDNLLWLFHYIKYINNWLYICIKDIYCICNYTYKWTIICVLKRKKRYAYCLQILFDLSTKAIVSIINYKSKYIFREKWHFIYKQAIKDFVLHANSFNNIDKTYSIRYMYDIWGQLRYCEHNHVIKRFHYLYIIFTTFIKIFITSGFPLLFYCWKLLIYLIYFIIIFSINFIFCIFKHLRCANALNFHVFSFIKIRCFINSRIYYRRIFFVTTY